MKRISLLLIMLLSLITLSSCGSVYTNGMFQEARETLENKQAIVLKGHGKITSEYPLEVESDNAWEIRYFLDQYNTRATVMDKRTEFPDDYLRGEMPSNTDLLKLCEKQNVDFILIPTYTMQKYSKDYFFLFTTKYIANVKINVFSRIKKEFVGEVNAVSTKMHHSRLLSNIVNIGTLLALRDGEVALPVMGAGFLIDIIYSAAEAQEEAAYQEAIEGAVEELYYRGRGGGRMQQRERRDRDPWRN